MREENIKCLQAVKMWSWRRTEEISWMEHKAIERVEKTGEERTRRRNHNKSKTKEVDRTHAQRRLRAKNGHGREFEGKAKKRPRQLNELILY